MAAKTVRVRLRGTYRWGGDKYGPGVVSVPQALADWLGATEEAEAPTQPSTPTTPPQTSSDLPESLPHRDLLTAGGLTSLEQVRGASREELIALKGIGEAKADQILEWIKANPQ